MFVTIAVTIAVAVSISAFTNSLFTHTHTYLFLFITIPHLFSWSFKSQMTSSPLLSYFLRIFYNNINMLGFLWTMLTSWGLHQTHHFSVYKLSQNGQEKWWEWSTYIEFIERKKMLRSFSFWGGTNRHSNGEAPIQALVLRCFRSYVLPKLIQYIIFLHIFLP